ncbi:MAG: antitoxin [Magnetococcales bacterium]|nr:antitoxin [Magnetococcales bacterium]MBF0157022.1 antitoxin [Magnetococcales bacterium]
MPAQTAKLFNNDRSQAVRLPREFRFQGNEVFIRREGEDVILSPRPQSWDDFFAEPQTVPEDFLADRKDLPPRNSGF